MATTSETDPFVATFSRSLEAANAALSEEAARYLLGLKLSDQDRERLNALAVLARRGTLSSEEAHELTELRRAAQLLDIFQLKARIAMQGPSGS